MKPSDWIIDKAFVSKRLHAEMLAGEIQRWDGVDRIPPAPIRGCALLTPLCRSQNLTPRRRAFPPDSRTARSADAFGGRVNLQDSVQDCLCIEYAHLPGEVSPYDHAPDRQIPVRQRTTHSDPRLPDHAPLSAKVLVLNRGFMALRVVSARRAFCMLAREVAEVIDVQDGQYLNFDFASWAEIGVLRELFPRDEYEWIRTVNLDIPVPRIVRLLGYDRLPRHEVKLNRRNLFARDRNVCQYCGKHFSSAELSIDHVVPRIMGGVDSWTNLVCACISCNARKGGRTPELAHMKLIRKPARPRRNPLIALRLGEQRYRSWRAFLDDAYWSVELK